MFRKTFVISFILASTYLLSSMAFANLLVKNGQISIDVSGSNGSYGVNGSNAGNVKLSLSYADAAKKSILIEGQTFFDNNSKPFSQIVPLSELNQISINASGGNGGSGYDGRNGDDGSNGYDGSNGSDGSDGCPPGNGTNGSNGGYGSSGSAGGDGSNGGNGGDAGHIQINVPADQSELLLLINASVDVGNKGLGGSGGSGGRGGRGGSGGRGGNAGHNNCPTDDNQTHDRSDGSSGSSGMDGSSGSDGPHGDAGSDGSVGSEGSLVFTTTSSNGAINYSEPFNLEISKIKSIDDNEDGVLEPGEALHITQLTVTNSSSMPTPVGQVINVLFKNSSTLLQKSAVPVILNELIPANSSKVFNFSKGILVFTTLNDKNLIGKEASINASFAINYINAETTKKTNRTIAWPITLKSKTDKANGYFGDALSVQYELQNISTREIGPTGLQPVEVEFSWDSKTIPGADVTAVLADGRSINLNLPVKISDLSAPAESTLNLPVKVTVKNSRSQVVTDGNLKIIVRLKDIVSGNFVAISSRTTPFRLVKDIRSLTFDNTIDLKSSSINCYFPNDLVKKLNVAKIEVLKSANSDIVSFKISRRTFIVLKTSPSVKGKAFDFAPFIDLLKQKTPDVNGVLDLLNTVVAPALQNTDKSWVITPGSCKVGRAL